MALALRARALAVDLLHVGCVVADAAADCLVVPANERLAGAAFSPAEAHAAGFAVGVVYPEQTVDGAVHAAAGPALARALLRRDAPPLEAGEARASAAFGLAGAFPRGLVHAVAPMHGAKGWERSLAQAWANALRLADEAGAASAAAPLLGAGARRVPLPDAARAAAAAAAAWDARLASCQYGRSLRLLRLATQDAEAADALRDALLDAGFDVVAAAGPPPPLRG